MACQYRPTILYITYAGLSEPLGQSQVLGYLERLASRAEIHILSFEKEPPSTALKDRLTRAHIDWIWHPYRKRPAVLSTLYDIWRACMTTRRLARKVDIEIVHARSFVPALMAIGSGILDKARFIFDMRGFWVDERIEGGIWRKGLLFRLAKTFERHILARADAVVTVTHASVPYIKAWLSGRQIPVVVIPTCTDLGRFAGNERCAVPSVIWCGSLGTWYRFDLAVRLAEHLGLPFKVLTPQTTQAQALVHGAADVRFVPPSDVPMELSPGAIGLSLIQTSFSKKASAPVRFAEYLAAGMPVAVTPGVGDLEQFVESSRVGVVIRGEDEQTLANASKQLIALAADPDTPLRCRKVAEQYFSVQSGATAYLDLYRQLSSPSR